MRQFLAAIFRNTIYPIVSIPLTYYAGMVLVRLSRKAREYTYTTGAKEEMKTVHFAGNLLMKVDMHSYMGGSIYWSGLHHLNEILFLGRALSDEMTFVDVGANQGEFAVFAASRLPHGRVLAFEPVSKTRALLIENKLINQLQQLEIFDYGLSDHVGSFPVFTSDDTTLHHGHHEGLSTLYKTEDRNVFEEEISLKVFDEIFYSGLERMDFVKIDVEGAELFVLKGMLLSLSKFRPDLMIEINEETFNAAGYSTSDIITFLKNLKYEAFQISRGRLKPISFSALHQWGNYIFRVVS